MKIVDDNDDMTDPGNTSVRCSKNEEANIVKIKLIRTKDSEGQQFEIRMLDDTGFEIGVVNVDSLSHKSKRILARAIRSTIENWSSRDASRVFRIFPADRSEWKLIKAIDDVVEKGDAELEVREYYVSDAELAFKRALTESKLRFNWKTYLTGHFVDFRIMGRDSIAVDIIEKHDDLNYELTKIIMKMEDLTRRGNLYYWLKGEDVLKDAYSYVKLIEDIVKREKIYPNGLLTKGFKVDKTTPTMEVLIKQQSVHSPSGSRIKFMNVFGILESGVIVLGTVRVPKRLWNFAKLLINILWEKGYWYDADVKSYSTMYRIFKEFGKVEFKVYRLGEEQLRVSSIGKVEDDRVEGVKDTDRLA